MTWENHGIVWHIDHIIPVVSFNLLDENEIFKCYHYTNLQPLMANENLIKQDRMPDGTLGRKKLTLNRNVV